MQGVVGARGDPGGRNKRCVVCGAPAADARRAVGGGCSMRAAFQRNGGLTAEGCL